MFSPSHFYAKVREVAIMLWFVLIKIDFPMPQKWSILASTKNDNPHESIIICLYMKLNVNLSHPRKGSGEGGWEVSHSLAAHTDTVTSLALNETGQLLATAGWDGRVVVWDTETGQRLGEVMVGEYFTCVSWTTAGLYSGGRRGRVVKIQTI